MGLFRGGKSKDDEGSTRRSASGPVVRDSGDGTGGERSLGPYDVSEVSDRGARVDLGAVWLPGVPGLELRMEVDKATQKITGVACAIAGSALQIQAFAAPRTEGIWDEIRGEISQSVTAQGGTVDDLPGPFGRELLTRLPATGPDGQQVVRPARFVGVDGPRWFLRGVLTGKAAVDPTAAQTLESIFAGVVVIRDSSPRPPRDLLALQLPDAAQGGPQLPEPPKPNFDPLTRGPEITEVR